MKSRRKFFDYETVRALKSETKFRQAWERNSKEQSAVNDAMIAAGRGHWRNAETIAAAKQGDPLAVLSEKLSDESAALGFYAEQFFGSPPYLVYGRSRTMKKNPRKRNPVENKTSAMKAITVKYHGATNTKPSRYRAFDSDNNSVTISTDYELEAYGNAAKAAEALQEKMGWGGTLVGGHTKDGWVFTFRQESFRGLPRAGQLPPDVTQMLRRDFGPKKNPRKRNPTGFLNIEKLAGKKHYTGYSDGVWRIEKGGRGWQATKRDGTGHFSAATLAEVSQRLELNDKNAQALDRISSGKEWPKRNPDDDYITRTKGGTSFTGSDVNIFRALAVANALRLYAKTGMKVNRAYTPKAMLAVAMQETGQTFKGKNKYNDAADALTALANEAKSAPRQNPRKRTVKKNPDNAFVIAISADGKRLTYDDTRGRFTDNSLPSLYATQIAAANRARGLLQKHRNLLQYKMTVEPASAKERGAVFGARPRSNPDRPGEPCQSCGLLSRPCLCEPRSRKKRAKYGSGSVYIVTLWNEDGLNYLVGSGRGSSDDFSDAKLYMSQSAAEKAARKFRLTPLGKSGRVTVSVSPPPKR